MRCEGLQHGLQETSVEHNAVENGSITFSFEIMQKFIDIVVQIVTLRHLKIFIKISYTYNSHLNKHFNLKFGYPALSVATNF